MTRGQRTRLDTLTSLRFFAALAVALLHLEQHIQPFGWLVHVTGLGYTGVGFFYVLSGFVLTWSHRDGDTAGRFYWRRFARVWPLHALTTVLAIAVIVGFHQSANWLALPLVLFLLQAWFYAPDIRYGFNGPSWSLSTEAFFYALFPLIGVRVLRERRLWRLIVITGVTMLVVAAVLAAIFPTSRLGWLLYTLPLYRLGEFVLGIAVASLIRRGWRPRWTLAQAAVAVAVSYAVVIAACDVILGNPERLPYFVADLWMLPSFVALIAAGARTDLGERSTWLQRPMVVRLGQWSFALYLIHELLLKVLAPSINRLPAAAGMLAGAAAICLAVLLSGAFHEWFEAPVERRLRRRLADRDPLAARPSATSAPPVED